MRIAASIFLCLLAVVCLAQAPVFEGKFVIKIDRWNGLFSDEYLQPDASYAADITNWEIKNESGRSFMQQRQGFIYVDTVPSAVTEARGYYISQIASDTERIFMAGNDNKLYQKTAKTAYLDLGVDGSTSDFCTFTLFKDTLIVTGNTRAWKIARNSGGSPAIRVVNTNHGNDTTVYNRMFLHQDRIYGYGMGIDSVESKLVWWPEFWIHSFDALPDTVTGGGYVYIGKDDGDFITNVLPQQNHIIAYKSRSIYKVMVSPSTNAPNEIVKLMGNIGAHGYDCVSEWNGNHYFMAENGVYEFDGVNFTKISDPINYWFADSITVTTGQSKFFKTCVVGNKLYVTLPIRNAIATPTVPGDLRHLVYDLDLKVWYKFDFTGDQASQKDTVTYLMRYEYSPNSAYPLTGAIKYGQKLLFTIDSTNNVNRTKLCMFPQGWQDRGTDTIFATWDGGFFPMADMYQRCQLERLICWGDASAIDTILMDFYSDLQPASVPNSQIDSIKIIFPAAVDQSGDMSNTRISPLVQGSLIRFRIRTFGQAVKINRMEFVGTVKGMAQE